MRRQARQVPELDPLTFMLILRRGVRRGGEEEVPELDLLNVPRRLCFAAQQRIAIT